MFVLKASLVLAVASAPAFQPQPDDHQTAPQQTQDQARPAPTPAPSPAGAAGQETAKRTSPFDQVVAAFEAGRKRDVERIIGGKDVALADNPWQVGLVVARIPDNFEAQFCGGSAIGGKWVVTAAHCMDKDVSEFRVFRGSAVLNASGKRVTVVRKIVHPSYDPATYDNDVALLELAEALPDTPVVPASPAEFGMVSSGFQVLVTGWGVVDRADTASKTLKGVEVPLQTMANCNAVDAYGGKVTSQMFCAGRVQGGMDSCQGDSGGPATAIINGNRRLIGIVSWGEGCALPKKYGVYTRVSNFASWIAANRN